MYRGYDIKDANTYYNKLSQACRYHIAMAGNPLIDGLPDYPAYIYTTNYNYNVTLNVITDGKVVGKSYLALGSIQWTTEKARTNSWLRVFRNTQRDNKATRSEKSSSKRRRKLYTQALQKFCALDNEYQLGLTSDEIASAAYDYADKKRNEDGDFWEVFESWNGILAVVGLIISISLFWVPGVGQVGTVSASSYIAGLIGVSTWVVQTAFTLTTIAAFAGSIYQQHTSNKAQGQAVSAHRYASAKAALQAQMKADEQRAVLTALMVYGGYSIYANNSVYNQNAPGSQTFNSQIAYDTTKGLRGDLPQDEIGDKIQGRYGGTLAGGVKFHTTLMESEMPLHTFTYGKEQKLDMLEKRLKNNVKRVAEGFTKLFEEYFNADEQGQTKYERVYKMHTDFLKKQMQNEVFLDTLKCYSKDLMQDFNYLNYNAFNEKKRNTMPIYLFFNNESYKIFMDEDNLQGYINNGYSEEEARKMLIDNKIKVYLQTLRLPLEYVEDCADEAIKARLIFRYLYDSHTDPDLGTTYDYRTKDFSLDSKQSDIYTMTYDADTGQKYSQKSITSQPCTFLGQNYYSFGYSESTDNVYHADDENPYVLSDFDLLGGFFKDDFDRAELTGDKMIALYKECLSHFVKVNDKYFFLIREIKQARTLDTDETTKETSFSTPFSNEFWAIEMPQKAYETFITPLYIPDKFKEDFENYDYASIKGFIL